MDQATMERSDTFCLCPRFSHTFSILGKKWNGLIIEVLLHEESQRFKDLALTGAVTGSFANGSRNWNKRGLSVVTPTRGKAGLITR
ncbi:hypothetical protein IV46_GL001608 [Limosilactobacillus fermentum]|nr:hypothetical protein IV46_GL001608 [Limosilactobacillus fermentum]